MNTYILFRNKGYAETLAERIGSGAEVRFNEDNLHGIIPQDNDIIIVDAHFGATMSDFGGLKIVAEMQEKYKRWGKKAEFKILSWFSKKEWKDEIPVLKTPKKQLHLQDNVDFVQLPVSEVEIDNLKN